MRIAIQGPRVGDAPFNCQLNDCKTAANKFRMEQLP